MRPRLAALALPLLLTACGETPSPTLDATLDTADATHDASLPPDRTTAPDVTIDATTPVDRHDATLPPGDVACGAGPVTLGTGQDAWEDIPCEGRPVELVMGPQGGWHIYGRVRMRGVAPDVFLSFSLVPEEGGAPVNLANETVRRLERRGLVRVGDAYESSAGELVILAEGVRPPQVVGRRFRFGVRVERPDGMGGRAFVAADVRPVTVIDERP